VTSAGLALAAGSAGVASAATAAATATVNIRSGPGTSSAVVGGLVRGQRISTTSKAKSGWVAVAFAGRNAYIASRYLDSTGALPPKPTKINTAGTKIATETLNVRSGPAAQRSVVGSVPQGRRLTLTGKLSGGYAQTIFQGRARWVSVAYLASTPGNTVSMAPRPVTSPSKGTAALAFAKKQLGKPYRFGAAGPSSYDCSGLTLAAWRSVGVTMPRTSQQQYRQGRKIARSQLRAGDLVFFYSQSPSHVGIYVGDGTIIHAPRPGRSVEYSKLSYMPYAGAVRPG
jgi:cell wall-associated NlpC family hydrolase